MVMQREQLSLRSQCILEHLNNVWQSQENLPPDALIRIVEVVVNLPEEHRTTGLQTVASEIVSSMHMRLLELVETFQQKTEQEGIRAKHRDETLKDVLPEIFDVIKETEGKVIIRSLDDLAVLVNITASLLLGSKTDSAEEAQTWLYELPSLYYNRLVKERLVIEKQEDASVWPRSYSRLNDLTCSFAGWSEKRVALPTRRVSDVSHFPVPVDLRLTSTAQHA